MIFSRNLLFLSIYLAKWPNKKISWDINLLSTNKNSRIFEFNLKLLASLSGPSSGNNIDIFVCNWLLYRKLCQCNNL